MVKEKKTDVIFFIVVRETNTRTKTDEWLKFYILILFIYHKRKIDEKLNLVITERLYIIQTQ